MPASSDITYAELAVTSNFSFLHGGSHAGEFVETAAKLGLAAIGVADRNTLAGIVRAHVAAKAHGVRLLVGVRLVLRDGFEVICYPTDRAAYGRLTKLLTVGSRRAPKGECHLDFDDLVLLGAGQRLIAMPPYEIDAAFKNGLARLSGLFARQTLLALAPRYRSNDQARFAALDVLARRHGTPLVATNDALYHIPDRRPLQDVLTCIRNHLTIEDAGFCLQPNAERHLKAPAEMTRLLSGYEHAVARTAEIMRDCTFSLDELSHDYPKETAGQSATPQEELERLAWLGAANRFPDGLPDTVRAAITHELKLIGELDFAPFFLTVHGIVDYARSLKPPILCQGRGSSANSVVCFCLGITSVNPTEIDLLFERFISAARGEPPDIDVDFEHERREEVIQHIYEKYGRHRAGLAATVIRYRSRSAVRDVGKVMGLSPDIINAVNGMVWGWSSSAPSRDSIAQAGLDPQDARVTQTLKLVTQLIGFPRHLSQHVGGFVITDTPLDEVVPIANAAMEDRTVVEWDKDDLDALNILKVDVLSLGMLTCLRKCFDLVRDHYGADITLANIQREDPETYAMIQKADTVGVFQIESRAQMSMLPRLKPQNFYDLVIEIAIVRPGPIQGGMVHPYLKRRQGLESVDYPSTELEAVLKKTLGVPLFQEQAMKIAIVGAGFPPEKADRLRRAMASFRNHGTVEQFKTDFVRGMIGNGYTPEFSERCFDQIRGFSDYGFPESHSASFALLAYASSWLKCHYPDAFACALLNSQPMGFYSASSIVRDFREHEGVVRPVDVNHSLWDHALEPLDRPAAPTGLGGNACAIRLGLRQVDGLREDAARILIAARDGPFTSMRDFHVRTRLDRGSLERLANADAFRSIGLDRRAALWEIKGLAGMAGRLVREDDLPLFARDSNGIAALLQEQAHVELPELQPGEQVVEDYSALSLSLKAHPVAFLREQISGRGIVTAKALDNHGNRRRVQVAGLVLVRQRPGTASGVIFMTLEDETGIANAIVWPKVFEKHRRIVMGARMVAIEGVLQQEQGVTHVVAQRLTDLTGDLMEALSAPAAATRTQSPSLWRHPRNVRMLPKGRNFH
ncbi:error-prone DNA polymerase [Oricola sp.]|uniref:error-prone DNA polymerase n=1 Tax=Oricola sp. TaxID=1979950 RepID=UPI0025D917F2|nr:error-prone DNA polymerase [Oricola sp.]MCI5076644.1 error-prone DNA polymerase [Oricola sp.]